MPKLPVVSGSKLVKLLTKLGYQVIRQRGSHIRLRKVVESGEHNITVPLHDEIAKGTLTDILSKVSVWNGISRDKRLRCFERSSTGTLFHVATASMIVGEHLLVVTGLPGYTFPCSYPAGSAAGTRAFGQAIDAVMEGTKVSD